ncbi:small RNA 2'-O-methyltransferase-like [Mercenaria mercenaria]|uniref:small RNA 2'-O-methyltransferase-like n=1 Tax=Mercenaria mercenaria TaxID=6596 RepID=UPI00234F1414|nr:small RNA 2'-O-methyltransferase-like [Mercenaria mercenaria]XP_053381057.1 small RNA 2'-O-methyltransferase-like [Mercenaria mercenaria]XP_053381058.1 small RNA 2'-O-methyltransferase-like [Mercenaria mercenaria]
MNISMAAALEEKEKGSECEDVFGGPVFEPRLYIQRYFYAKQQLAKFGVKHVVDFGSAECKISRFLVQIPTLEKLALVDLDQGLLEWNKYSIRPLTCDYLEKRDLPLQVQVFCGSVTELDESVIGCDGVSMVELIEHLHPEVLSAAVAMVFGKLQPCVIVITTPNSDFNQLFPNFSGMRHWDHKFEWSRQEFQSWCEEICKNHPYTAEYGGIGEPPPGSEHLGHCSQSAVFVRKLSVPKIDHSGSVTNNYKLITESVYPFVENKMSEDETVSMEINYQLRQYRNMCSEEYRNCITGSGSSGNQNCFTSSEQFSDSRNLNFRPENEGNQPEDSLGTTGCPDCAKNDKKLDITERLVPISYLMTRKIKSILQPDQLRKFLQSHGYRLSSDCNNVIISVEEHQSDSDDDKGYNNDNDIETWRSASESDQAVESELLCQPSFSLNEALQCESWD